MARHRRRAQGVIPLDPDNIRARQREAVAEEFSRVATVAGQLPRAAALANGGNAADGAIAELLARVAPLMGAASIVHDAERVLTDTELVEKRDESLLSLAFFGDLEGLAPFGGMSKPTFDTMRRTALGLTPESELPTGAEASAAARAAGIREIPRDQAIINLVEASGARIAASARKDFAMVIRQDAALRLSEDDPYWTASRIGALLGVTDVRVRKDWSIARNRRLAQG